MPWPPDLTTRTVTASYPNGGTGLTGLCTFTLTADLADPAAPAILRAVSLRTPVTGGVMAPIVLPCTDNPGLTPSGSAWTVTEQLDGAPPRAWSFFLPSAGPDSVDLASLTRLDTPPVLVQYLLAVNDLDDIGDPAAARANLGIVAAADAVQGLVTPPGGNAEFYRADGTWAEPPGGAGAVDSVNGHTGDVDLDAEDVGAIPAADAGAPGGVATLDGSGRLPATQGANLFPRQIVIAANDEPSALVAPVGSWTVGYLPETSLGDVWAGWIAQSDGNQNSSRSYDCTCAAGVYTLAARHLAYNSRGIYTVTIGDVEDDGTVVNSTAAGSFDGYADTFTVSRAVLTGIALSAGDHVITLAMLGKNPSSTGYFGLLELMILTRTA